MRRPLLPSTLLLGLVGLTAGCGSGAAGQDGGKLRVVTTVAPITSLVAAVGGDRVRVDGIVPEGTNSHTFEPPPSAAAVLSDCDVVFANGLGLEESTIDLARRSKPGDCTVVELGQVLTPDQYIYDFSFPKQDGKPNPHLWTDPKLALRYAETILDVLQGRLPGDQAYLRANFDALKAQIEALDRAITAATATVPAQQRALLTYHDGYAYFARDYGWKIIGAIQPSNFEDPTPREVADLIRQVRQLKVPAIFGSEVFPSKVLETIGRETGARYVDTLRDDDLPGRPGDTEHSWLGLMRYDFVTMVEALGGDAAGLRQLDVTPAVPDRARYPQ